MRQEQWRALEQIYYAGKARSIGVSHYCPRHLDGILGIATVQPSLDQMGYHVGSGVNVNDNVRAYGRERGVTFTSFSLLCGPSALQHPARDSLVTGSFVTRIEDTESLQAATQPAAEAGNCDVP